MSAFLICSVCAADSGSLSEADRASLDYLGDELGKAADYMLTSTRDIDIYTTMDWKSAADIFPEKFDLRDRGIITPVKDQTPWSTCWSFATVAASETSILSSLGLTAEEYKEKFGEEMNLSEKHLAWFAANALPDPDAYPEGEYPFNEAQAGEGYHSTAPEEGSPFDFGGTFSLSTSTLASGIGILKEKYAPYGDSDGLLVPFGDWSLPEDLRFSVSYELKNANVLPSPAFIDEHGNYTYRPAGTEAIKTELMAGRPVGISFLADQCRRHGTGRGEGRDPLCAGQQQQRRQRRGRGLQQAARR